MNRRQLPVVRTLIAAPCDVPWGSMEGDEKKRHCSQCSRDVHNLSAMTTAEMEAFLAAATPDETGHLPCISLFQRSDGTVLTSDCPIGVSRRRRRALLTSTLGIGGVALVAMSALATLWLDHKRELAPEVATTETPAVLNTNKPPAYPPPLPSEITNELTTVQMAGGMMMMPPMEPEKPVPPKKEVPTRIKGKMAR